MPIIENANTIKKNGQIYLVDPLKKTKGTSVRQKNQVSLLKPNLSLLKPSVLPSLEKSVPLNPGTAIYQQKNIITDHDYAGYNTLCPPPPIKSLLSKIPIIKSIFPIKTSSIKKSFSYKKHELNYRKILESVFAKSIFSNQQSAIIFLLKKLPLTTLLVKKSGYYESFPFTVESTSKYNELSKIKQSNYQWLRAKLIQKWLKKKFQNIEDKLWTTKEIMQFAKRYGYTPNIVNSIKRTNIISNNSENNLKNLIEQEIKKEKEDCHQTLTLNHDIYSWVNDYVTNQISTMASETEPINVEHTEDTDILNSKNVIKSKYEMKNVRHDTSLKLWVPLESTLEQDGETVANMCDDIGIRLDSEEIVENVYYPGAKRILVNVFQNFMEDIVRRAFANRMSIISKK